MNDMVTQTADGIRYQQTTGGWTSRIVGKVFTPIEIANLFDVERAAEGVLPFDRVRRVRIERALVDTGASHLFLPADMIASLGLRLVEVIPVDTAAGPSETRVFTGVRVTVGDRTDIFSCIELPGGRNPLVGVIVMETLGLQPDVINHRLLFLPRNETGSYVTA